MWMGILISHSIVWTLDSRSTDTYSYVTHANTFNKVIDVWMICVFFSVDFSSPLWGPDYSYPYGMPRNGAAWPRMYKELYHTYLIKNIYNKTQICLLSPAAARLILNTFSTLTVIFKWNLRRTLWLVSNPQISRKTFWIVAISVSSLSRTFYGGSYVASHISQIRLPTTVSVVYIFCPTTCVHRWLL